MSETEFCYSCRKCHPRDEMSRVHTRNGMRWRCRRSIEAARCSAAERDAFGRLQTEINLEAADYSAKRMFIPFLARRLQR